MDFTRRNIMMTGLAATLAPLASRAAAAPPAARDALWYVHPELRTSAALIQRATASLPALSAESLAMTRDMVAKFTRPPLSTVPFEKRVIPGRGDPRDVVIYVVNAKPGTRRPGILHTHGGGYIAGSVASDLANLQELASKLDCAIVSVDYRLAPETRYTGSIEDNYCGLRWLHDNADALGVDPARIAVMGESAGGGHAALLAITARDRGEVPVVFQCLLYPMLDDRTASSRPVQGHVGTLVWTAQSNRYGWRSFLGQEPGTDKVPAAAVPARTKDLSGLPPAWIGVGSIDLFVAEDTAYAQRLIAADVMTELVVVPGAFHGFESVGAGASTSIAQEFTASKIRALQRALAPRPA